MLVATARSRQILIACHRKGVLPALIKSKSAVKGSKIMCMCVFGKE